MTAVAFDTLKLARKLRDTAQMSQVQAEGVADALAEAMSGAELATKGDLRELDLKMTGRFDAADERLERRAAEIEGRLIKWMVGTGAAAILSIIGSAWAIIRYMPPTH